MARRRLDKPLDFHHIESMIALYIISGIVGYLACGLGTVYYITLQDSESEEDRLFDFVLWPVAWAMISYDYTISRAETKRIAREKNRKELAALSLEDDQFMREFDEQLGITTYRQVLDSAGNLVYKYDRDLSVAPKPSPIQIQAQEAERRFAIEKRIRDSMFDLSQPHYIAPQQFLNHWYGH